jgi:hypothetical protein
MTPYDAEVGGRLCSVRGLTACASVSSSIAYSYFATRFGLVIVKEEFKIWSVLRENNLRYGPATEFRNMETSSWNSIKEAADSRTNLLL